MVQLPVFGQPLDKQQRVFDGPVGQKINAQLEQKLGATVIGPWLPLGYSNHYSTRKPLTEFEISRAHEDPQLGRRRPDSCVPSSSARSQT